MTKTPPKSTGQKKALTPKQVRLLKEVLKNRGAIRDLALLSLAIDTMLRASDLLKLTVSDVVDFKGRVYSEVAIKQQKTNTGHMVMISEGTQTYILDLIKAERKYEDDFLFSSRKNERLSMRGYSYLVKQWVFYLGLDPKYYSTHSLRRTRASFIYKETGNVEAVRLLLGQNSVSSTSHYLGLDKKQALDIGRRFVL